MNQDILSLARARMLAAAGAMALPAAAAVGSDSGDTGEPEMVCVSPDEAGACPESETVIAGIDDSGQTDSAADDCTPQVSGGPVVVDGQCCYEVHYDCLDYQLVGCGFPSPGRSFRVARTALSKRAIFWNSAVIPLPALAGLDDAQRSFMAGHWARIGLSELMAVSAFRRQTSALNRHRAPNALTIASTRAIQEESNHARWAFTMASHFAGCPVSPAIQASTGAIEHADVEELLRSTVHDGCHDETLSVGILLHMQRVGSDPATSQLLNAILRDELKHAADAWATARWLIDANPAARNALAHQSFSEAKLPVVVDFAVPAGLQRFGVLGPSALAAALRSADTGLVRPARDRLLAA